MLSFNELWDILVEKKPKLSSPKSTATFDTPILKTLLEQFYNQGVKHEAAKHPQKKCSPLKDLPGLKGLFDSLN